MEQITTPSGATLSVLSIPFHDCMNLKNAIIKEVAKTGLNLDKVNLKDVAKTQIDDFLKPILQVDCSDEFIAAFFKCAERCLYNDEKITKLTFESDEAREDYYFIMFHVVKKAVVPFFKGLVTGLPQILTNLPKVKSPASK